VSEQEPGTPRTPADLAAFFQAATERLMAGWTTAAGGSPGGGAPAPAPPGIPALPATLSTRQLQALLDDLAARRAQVKALATQLAAFDDQLGSLEANLRPVLDWVKTWADLEKSVTSFWRPPGGASPRAGEG
jgi:outer membrane protein TolC